jgi:hypothetical protein
MPDGFYYLLLHPVILFNKLHYTIYAITLKASFVTMRYTTYYYTFVYQTIGYIMS